MAAMLVLIADRRGGGKILRYLLGDSSRSCPFGPALECCDEPNASCELMDIKAQRRMEDAPLVHIRA